MQYKFRTELAALIPPTGYAVELGVAAGVFSDQLLASAPGFLLYSIDRWSDHHDTAERDRARELLSRHGARSRVIQGEFATAIRVFKDASLDFIYIDGYAHSGQDDGKTLRDWWPKLKPGGIFAGHDYHPDFPATVEAVHLFLVSIGRGMMEFNLTHGDQYPSWWFRK